MRSVCTSEHDAEGAAVSPHGRARRRRSRHRARWISARSTMSKPSQPQASSGRIDRRRQRAAVDQGEVDSRRPRPAIARTSSALAWLRRSSGRVLASARPGSPGSGGRAATAARPTHDFGDTDAMAEGGAHVRGEAVDDCTAARYVAVGAGDDQRARRVAVGGRAAGSVVQARRKPQRGCRGTGASTVRRWCARRRRHQRRLRLRLGRGRVRSSRNWCGTAASRAP